MDKASLSKHISSQFNIELEDIRNRVLAMGGLVEEQLRQATDALIELDFPKARAVMENDHRVNAAEVAIDEECTQIIARRQPAASDLRLVIMVIKTITDLERVGDEAEKIARMAVSLSETPQRINVKFANMLHVLSDHVRLMLQKSLDAFARMDVELALEVGYEELKANREYETLMRALVTYMMEDPRTIRAAIDVMWAARALERVGDHAKNVGEYVIYMVKGKDVRHTTLEHVAKELGLTPRALTQDGDNGG